MTTELRGKSANKITFLGVIVNISLLLFKFTAGILGHSTAMIADAVHTLTDFATDIFVIVGVKWGSKPRDADHPYGHGKYETITAAMIALALGSVGVGIGWEGLSKILEVINSGIFPERPGFIAFIAAMVSVVLKEILFHLTFSVGKKIKSEAVIANAWHHRSDALSSIGTALGIGGAVFLGAQWTILDPLAAVVVSFFIVRVAWKILQNALGDLTEKTVPDSELAEIEHLLRSIPEASDPHNIRCRRVGTTLVLEVHIRMDGNMSLQAAHDATSRMESLLKFRFGPEMLITIHMEPIKNYPKGCT